MALVGTWDLDYTRSVRIMQTYTLADINYLRVEWFVLVMSATSVLSLAAVTSVITTRDEIQGK